MCPIRQRTNEQSRTLLDCTVFWFSLFIKHTYISIHRKFQSILVVSNVKSPETIQFLHQFNGDVTHNVNEVIYSFSIDSQTRWNWEIERPKNKRERETSGRKKENTNQGVYAIEYFENKECFYVALQLFAGIVQISSELSESVKHLMLVYINSK